MSEVPTDFNPVEHRAKWLKRLADELDKTEALMPLKFLPDGVDYPPWVLKVEREFQLSVLPAAKLKDSDVKLTPKRMGALLGHMCEKAVWMMEWFNDQSENSDEKAETSLSEDKLKKGQDTLISIVDWYGAIRRLAKRALCSSVDQNYPAR